MSEKQTEENRKPGTVRRTYHCNKSPFWIEIHSAEYEEEEEEEEESDEIYTRRTEEN